jgi:hypothetical protein
MQQFGETYEHRPLMLAVITSPKNRAALDAIRANVAALTDPNATTQAQANEIAHTSPAIAWLAYGVHGNESSSSEAAMQVASTLVSDPQSAPLLDNLVILIDPLQNPDGRERYVQWFIRTRGADADPNADAFEHAEPWPGGRFNHYLVDMNRDWTWTSQRETLARVALYRTWNPQVFVIFTRWATSRRTSSHPTRGRSTPTCPRTSTHGWRNSAAPTPARSRKEDGRSSSVKSSTSSIPATAIPGRHCMARLE